MLLKRLLLGSVFLGIVVLIVEVAGFDPTHPTVAPPESSAIAAQAATTVAVPAVAKAARVKLNAPTPGPKDINVVSIKRLKPAPSVTFPFQSASVKYSLTEIEMNLKSGTSFGAPGEGGVTMEDFATAKANIIYELPEVEGMDGTTSPMRLFNQIKNDIQGAALDGRPIVVDFGCTLGSVFAAVHPNATVICVHEHNAIPQVPSAKDALKNLIHIASPTTFLDPKFLQFYEVCNFFTIVIAMYPLSQSTPLPGLLSHIAALIPSSAVIFAAVPSENAKEVLDMQPPKWTSLAKGNSGAAQSTDKNADMGVKKMIKFLSAEDIVEVSVNSLQQKVTTTFTLLKISLGQSIRTCRKTWNAPVVQWGRTQTVQFDEGLVTFQVHAVSPTSGAVEETTRVIHPLQYIHSINLDTLLGVGVDEVTRMGFLGQMIATPRYSDPLPHNWVVGGGGRVLRIDKVDRRYDGKVDEGKMYWGRSSAGYMHLLAYHLCIPVGSQFELPAVLYEDLSVLEGRSTRCPAACERCGDSCSYLPKGSSPCEECNVCGSLCIGNQAVEYLRLKRKGPSTPQSCQMTYPSMHAARKLWAKWEPKPHTK